MPAKGSALQRLGPLRQNNDGSRGPSVWSTNAHYRPSARFEQRSGKLHEHASTIYGAD
jgi:hypothetical protein